MGKSRRTPPPKFKKSTVRKLVKPVRFEDYDEETQIKILRKRKEKMEKRKEFFKKWEEGERRRLRL
jgi:hypothetical protein